MVFQKKVGLAAFALSSLVLIAYASVPSSAPLKATLSALDTLRSVGATAAASTDPSGNPSPAVVPPRPNAEEKKAEPPDLPTPEIESIQTISGKKVEKQINQAKLEIHVKKAPPATRTPPTEAKLKAYAGKDGTIPVINTADQSKPEFDFGSFMNQGEQKIVVRWVMQDKVDKKKEHTSQPSELIPLTFDSIGPMAESVRLIGSKGGDAILEITFDQPDLDEAAATNKAHYQITRTGGLGSFIVKVENNVGTPALAPDGKTVVMKITEPVTDTYQVEITPKVVDLAGNSAGYRDGKPAREQKLQFSSYPERLKGEHVEFPDFVQRQKPAPGGFNPGDKVETRVVRLYYYRDAHRVAEIINRNVQSFNRAAVDQKRREAEASRQRADTATDDRRSKERQAVQAAQAARQAERDVELAEAAAARARTTANLAATNLKFVQTQITSAQTTFDNAKTAKEKAEEANNKIKDTDSNDAKSAARQNLTEAQTYYAQAEQEVERLKKVQTAASDANKIAQEDLREKGKELNDAQAKLEIKRNNEIANREEWLQTEAKEDRAKEDQFRKEVAAAHEDPDTYVAGKVNSIDPVTQVSISVIGEGLIQLRGPIRGINKIRTMIDQIDTPVGQVKVGIFTVQINGEHGDRMEKVAQRIEGNIDVSRFLTAQSMMLLRRAVQEIASDVAQEADRGGHYQVDRDRKYLYSFFGRDFVDELYAMDSEFLYSGNKVLSIHSMDTVSRSNALFVMALAKNSVRQKILERCLYLIRCELPKAEYDFRKASSVLPCDRNTQREIMRKAQELYTFRSLRGMFDVPMTHEKEDLITPMQREFIRLGQIFKSQLVAEVELKQRVVERGLIEDPANEDLEKGKASMLAGPRNQALINFGQAHWQLLESSNHFDKAVSEIQVALIDIISDEEAFVLRTQDAVQQKIAALEPVRMDLKEREKKLQQVENEAVRKPLQEELQKEGERKIEIRETIVEALDKTKILSNKTKQYIIWLADDVEQRYPTLQLQAPDYSKRLEWTNEAIKHAFEYGAKEIKKELAKWQTIRDLFEELRDAARDTTPTLKKWKRVRGLSEELRRSGGQSELCARDPEEILREIILILADLDDCDCGRANQIRKLIMDAYLVFLEKERALEARAKAESFADITRSGPDHRKLLDFLIDEKEEKWIELREGTKAHIATMDNHLKRLAIALEDDFKVQFYDPAFAEVRKAAREWDVNLGQVERTTILTNNRAFAKVTPQATMEFDLPKRDILILEAMKGAKAMTQEFGSLMQDPTFLAATKMLSGSPTSSVSSAPKGNVSGAANSGQSGPQVKTVLPTLPSSSEEQIMNQSGGQERELGSALEALIPDPAIYKFETGTGFEIRPVIQPDGDSVIYDFNYMYTTNVREPVRADEKHLGRVKRHFIDTQVQTSSYELREISRYQVALKASRTSRGVPLFEDIPALGVLFRPLPSAESSLQQNIILGQSVVYPTLFDLMGLRWARHVVDLDHDSLRDEEHVVRGRHKTISDFVFEEASDKVDGFLGIKYDTDYKKLRRPDLYHRQDRPSPHHPSGYSAPCITDPTGKQFEVPDRRPVEMRDPPFDSKHRTPIEQDKMETLSDSGVPRLILPMGKSADSKTTRTSDPAARRTPDIAPARSAQMDSAVRPAQHEQALRDQPAKIASPEKQKASEDSPSTIGSRFKRLIGR